MAFIGIDIGSSYVKAAVLDLKAHSIRDEQRFASPGRKLHDNPRIFEIDASVYVKIVKDIVKAFIAAGNVVSGLVISTQMHGVVVDDTYISWQDSRCLDEMKPGLSYLDFLKDVIPPERMKNHGVYLKPSLGICNLYAKLCREGRLDADVTVFTLGSYIIHALTGRNICHMMNAAPLGLADVKTDRWDLPLLQAAGLSQVSLPDIADEDFIACGVYHVDGYSIPVYPDYGDQQVSILGSGVVAKEAVINIATASQVCVVSPDFKPGRYETRPYFANHFLRVVSNMPGGRNLDVLAVFVQNAVKLVTGKDCRKEDVYEALARQRCQADGLQVDTCFYPTYDDFTGGSITGIREQNLTLERLFSAAYADMAHAYLNSLRQIVNEQEIDSLLCIGGAARKNRALIATLEQAAGIPCRLSDWKDEAMHGLYKIAEQCLANQSQMKM